MDGSIWDYYAGIAKDLLTERFTEIARAKSCFELVLKKKASIKMLTEDDLVSNLFDIARAEERAVEPYSQDSFIEVLTQLRLLAEDKDDLDFLSRSAKTVMDRFFCV